MEKQSVELSLQKKFKKSIWNQFIGGLKDYQLLKAGDKVAVCISGGKDSILLAKCMQLLQRYSEIPFDLEFLVMNPGYNQTNWEKIEKNVQLLDIPIKSFQTDIFQIVAKQEGAPCYLCARMRRGYLYKEAKALGCNKIALGHHFDDVIETILMSMMYGGEFKTMMPKLHSKNYGGMELIRPFYLVREKDIIVWQKYHELEFIRCACLLTENDEHGDSKRQEVKLLLEQLRKTSSYIDKNIFKSIHNVNLETIIGWYQGENTSSFLDEYEVRKD